ncbi:hypothetical protein HJ588_13485 [Flexivirga sp. ID2601S]|uniref:Uncharacterized protein n=1 Tax=Flexivirga aerilata TaxID=1656889 RepID=A0A849AIR3_9MICO|nr:hypothetical protein [Flexivirga aerilata]NNG40279.1 hypothetical protein [Flexivirga aerilata]
MSSKRTSSKADPKVVWLQETQAHDYPAAASYLSLLAVPKVVDKVVASLRKTTPTHFKAKDILRAAQLPLLPLDNEHVVRDLRKIIQGEALSPVLLVRGDLRLGVAAQVADGYHRVCASYHVNENTDIPVTIVDLPTR